VAAFGGKMLRYFLNRMRSIFYLKRLKGTLTGGADETVHFCLFEEFKQSKDSVLSSFDKEFFTLQNCPLCFSNKFFLSEKN
jgi:hypothetical protein